MKGRQGGNVTRETEDARGETHGKALDLLAREFGGAVGARGCVAGASRGETGARGRTIVRG